MTIIPKEIEEKSRKMYFFLFFLMLAAYFGLQSWQMMITNFAVEEGAFNGLEVGLLQSVKELPGLLSFFAVYVLLIAKEHHLANFFVFLLGVGVFFTGYLPSLGGILITAFIMSTGYHFYETLSQSMILQYFSLETTPIVLGKMRGLTAAASVLAALLIIILSQFFSFYVSFMVMGSLVMIVALFCFKSNPVREDIPIQKRSLQFKKEYWLFYVMTILSGGRRQIFIVFGMLLLVEKFKFSVTEITLIILINNVVNFVLNPLLGKAVNYFGERKIATTEYSLVIAVFACYAFTENALFAAVLFIIDQFLINFMIAERTFFQKISAKEDITSGTAVGFTLNHIAAVSIPLICGALWLIDYRIAFYAGIVIAIINLIFIQMMDKELKKAVKRKAISNLPI